jgi:hypothetical protein
MYALGVGTVGVEEDVGDDATGDPTVGLLASGVGTGTTESAVFTLGVCTVGVLAGRGHAAGFNLDLVGTMD